LNTVNKNKPFEYLRLTALGVIGALVKVDNSEVINFLLNTEIIPLCLRIMERGSELSKTVATFIVQRILLDDNGLNYVCNTAERFYAVSTVLYNMINGVPTSRLIKHVIRCYARLAENSRVSSILKENLPPCFRDKQFFNNLDEGSKRWVQNLFKNLSNVSTTTMGQPQGKMTTTTGMNQDNTYSFNTQNQNYGNFNPNPYESFYYNQNFSSDTNPNSYMNNSYLMMNKGSTNPYYGNNFEKK